MHVLIMSRALPLLPPLARPGDNFYGAITEVDSPRFDALWTDVYNAVPSLDGLPWLFSLGNHDIDDNPGKELILAERAQVSARSSRHE